MIAKYEPVPEVTIRIPKKAEKLSDGTAFLNAVKTEIGNNRPDLYHSDSSDETVNAGLVNPGNTC